MTTFAYLRVSTDQQDLDNQRHGILEYANSHRLGPLEFVEDAVSGRAGWRERAVGALLLETASENDVVLFAEVSRMGRSTLQVLEMLETCMKRGLSVHIAKQRMVLDGSMQSRITATVLGLAAEIERELISQRTSEALARRKAAGRPLGRPKGRKAASLKRSTVFALDGIHGEQEAYIRWLLGQCATEEAETVISDEAIEFLAERLATPLQIERYLTLAFEQAHEIAEKPVSAGLVDSVLAPGLDELEPRLARHGYNARILAHELDIRQAEVRAFRRGTLPPGRTEEIHKQLLAKGIPA